MVTSLSELSGSTGSGGVALARELKERLTGPLTLLKNLKIPAVVIDDSIQARVKA